LAAIASEAENRGRSVVFGEIHDRDEDNDYALNGCTLRGPEDARPRNA
jgi:hypothetical protein